MLTGPLQALLLLLGVVPDVVDSWSHSESGTKRLLQRCHPNPFCLRSSIANEGTVGHRLAEYRHGIGSLCDGQFKCPVHYRLDTCRQATSNKPTHCSHAPPPTRGGCSDSISVTPNCNRSVCIANSSGNTVPPGKSRFPSLNYALTSSTCLFERTTARACGLTQGILLAPAMQASTGLSRVVVIAFLFQ